MVEYDLDYETWWRDRTAGTIVFAAYLPDGTRLHFELKEDEVVRAFFGEDLPQLR